ncbi:unnamed protein product [Gadus morhua 'NCC']
MCMYKSVSVCTHMHSQRCVFLCACMFDSVRLCVCVCVCEHGFMFFCCGSTCYSKFLHKPYHKLKPPKFYSNRPIHKIKSVVSSLSLQQMRSSECIPPPPPSP